MRMQTIMLRARRALRLHGMAADAFHLLTVIPSAALACFLLSSPRAALRCFAFYGLYGYLPLPRNQHTLGGRALTIGMAWHSLDDQFVPPRSDGTNTMRLPAAVVVGLLLEVACRNLMKVLESLTSSRLPRDLSLAITADRWPRGAPPPPQDVSATRCEPWSPEAIGVAIRDCNDLDKGQGVFATGPIHQGKVIGVYMGELLSQRAYGERHRKPRLRTTPPAEGSAEHARMVEERKERIVRLVALKEGAPIGGVSNDGKYGWELLPSSVRYSEDRIAYIDGEDPDRSSWVRYINNAPTGSDECNLIARVNAHRCRVWFEARRDIAEGEELHYDYRSSWGWR